jgi:VP5 protein
MNIPVSVETGPELSGELSLFTEIVEVSTLRTFKSLKDDKISFMYNAQMHKNLELVINTKGDAFLRVLAQYNERTNYMITQLGLGMMCDFLVANKLPEDKALLSAFSFIMFGIYPKKHSDLKDYDITHKYTTVKNYIDQAFGIEDKDKKYYLECFGSKIVKFDDLKEFKKSIIDAKNFDLISTEVGYFSARNSQSVTWFYLKGDKDYVVSPYSMVVRIPKVQYSMLYSEAKALVKLVSTYDVEEGKFKSVRLFVNSSVKQVLKRRPPVASNHLRNFLYDVHNIRYFGTFSDARPNEVRDICYTVRGCLLDRCLLNKGAGVSTYMNFILEDALLHLAGIGFNCASCTQIGSPESFPLLGMKQTNMKLYNYISEADKRSAEDGYPSILSSRAVQASEPKVKRYVEATSTDYVAQKYVTMEEFKGNLSVEIANETVVSPASTENTGLKLNLGGTHLATW